MKKRVFAILAATTLLLGAVPMFGVSVAADTPTKTASWTNGGISISAATLPNDQAVTDFGYGYYSLNCSDARGSITAPNLNDGPYYMMVGMDGQYPTGHWAQLTISNDQRNQNWFDATEGDVRIYFPGPTGKNIEVKNKNATGGVAGVAFMPKTAYLFKFAKEKNGSNVDVLVIYCNGVKVYEDANSLKIFSKSKLWFTTSANVGANDTLQTTPMFINPEPNLTAEPMAYTTTGPRSGANGYSSYTADLVKDGMYSLYDDNGYTRVIMDSTWDDGWYAQKGESVSTQIKNTYKDFTLSVIGDKLPSHYWLNFGIYAPGSSINEDKCFSNNSTVTINMNNGSNSSMLIRVGDTKYQIMEGNGRINAGEETTYRFQLVEGEVDKIHFYYNGALHTTFTEDETRAAQLFTMMRSDELRIGMNGHRNSDFPVVRFKVYNGNGLNVSTLADKDSYNAGEIITVTTTLKNNSATAVNDLTVRARMSSQLVSVGDPVKTVNTVAAGGTVTVVQKFRAIEGGRPMINVTVTDSKDAVLNKAQWFVSVNGAGWYAGDNHSHSQYSDGAATIAVNCASAYEKGLSYLYSTDHNSIEQWVEVEGVNAKYTLGDFINIAGNEASSHNHGHALALRIPYTKEANMASVTPGQGGWNIDALGQGSKDWQYFIDQVNGWGGLFFVAHPNDRDNPELGFREVYDVKGITGIEAWNSAFAFDHIATKGAFKIWDSLNVRGDKLVGIGNSDSHGAPDIGSVHVKGYMNALKRENVDNMLESGHLYGTSGPDLWFDIDGTGMGDTLNIKGDSADVRITVKAWDDNAPLTKVTLYKLHVTGEISDEALAMDMQPAAFSTAMYMYNHNLITDTKEVVKTWDLTGQNKYSFSAIEEVTAQAGDFFRIEVESEKNSFYDGSVANAENDPGFAFSNPIWVEKADKAGDIRINTITLDTEGAAVKQTLSGQYYVTLEDAGVAMSASDLNVVLAGDAVVTSKSYDADKQMFELMLTAEDGSTKNLAIYVAAEPAASADFSDPFVPNNGAATTTTTSTTTTTTTTTTNTTTTTTTAGDEDSFLPDIPQTGVILTIVPLLLMFLGGALGMFFLKKKRA